MAKLELRCAARPPGDFANGIGRKSKALLNHFLQREIGTATRHKERAAQAGAPDRPARVP
jgi:hypothetical protein